ncbi:MAG: hypothetical protein LBU32_15595 [Clostridiales bacterium]|nr:hypothetical protein [Clostridiales bacterium]
MDTALQLRIVADNGDALTKKEISHLLRDSELVLRLTSEFQPKPLYAIWRIVALAEIPHSYTLDYTKGVVEYIERHLATESGFTLTGKAADLLPCYNAMLLEAYSKLGISRLDSARNSLKWILGFQPFERGIPSVWTGRGVQKYGGCLKRTPCFLGIAKSVKALAYYAESIGWGDSNVNALIEKGLEYVLTHRLYKRLSNGEPINAHMLDISFPASYQLNVVELLDLARLTSKLADERCSDALQYVRSKRLSSGAWKNDYSYKADGYLTFDRRGKEGEWISYVLGRICGAFNSESKGLTT